MSMPPYGLLSQAPNAAIGTALRWETLRSEATDLFASQEINAGLFIHDGNWISFSSALLNDLREKPIPLANGSIDKQEIAPSVCPNDAEINLGPPDIYARELSIDHRREGHEGSGFYWTVECKRDGPFAATVTGALFKV